MPKAHTTWNVLPHRPIEVVTENLWRVEGKLENMPLQRVMTIARRVDGDLVIHNAIALDDASMTRIDAWGRVAHVIVPNRYHRLDARVYKDRYPAARVLCPRGARPKVEQVVPVEGAYEDFPADPGVTFETLDGVADREGVMIVRSDDGVTLVFNDAVFNMPHRPGFMGWVLRHIVKATGGPRVELVYKLLLIDDREAFRAHLLRLAELPALRRVIVSHHQMITDDPAGALRRAIETL